MTSHSKLAAAAAVLAAGAGAAAIAITDECETAEVWCPAAAWAEMGRPAESGYGLIQSCAEPVTEEFAACTVLQGTERRATRIAEPRARAWGRRDSEAPYQCACRARDGQCEVMGPEGWMPAPEATTLSPGTFRGQGCVASPCVALSGHSSPMAEVCR
jgi:hypothetical protein